MTTDQITPTATVTPLLALDGSGDPPRSRKPWSWPGFR